MDNVFVQSVPKIAKRLVSENSDSSGNMKTAIPRARRDSVHGIASAGAQRSQIASSREDSVSSDGDDEDPLGDLERAAALKSSISTHKSASPPGNRPATDTRSKYNLLEAEHLQFLLRRVDRRRGIPTSLSPTAPSSTTAGTSSSSDVSATGVSQSSYYQNSPKASRFRTQGRVGDVRELEVMQERRESQADRDFDDEEGKGAVGMPWRVLLRSWETLHLGGGNELVAGLGTSMDKRSLTLSKDLYSLAPRSNESFIFCFDDENTVTSQPMAFANRTPV
ncbi:hypothetical protein KC348_g56 [Hortaea werneckii]|nr:hypothetical protein KC348_g56 [Hortaea werneckii]